MINPSVINEIHKLASQYEAKFGKEIDYIGLPSTISQEKLLQALRIIVNTGDSVLVGLEKLRNLVNPYFDYLENYHESHPNILNGFIFPKPCPLCGEIVSYYKSGNSYMYKCETSHCLIYQIRGI